MKFKVRIPNSLKIRLSKYHHEQKVKIFINETGQDALNYVKQYGVGTAGGNTNPTGGAPVWQGKIETSGHYRGYLGESHFLRRVAYNHVQIASSADFVEGLMEGVSTNWFNEDGYPVTFPPNYYHKRAVDSLIIQQHIPVNWRRAERGTLSI